MKIYEVITREEMDLNEGALNFLIQKLGPVYGFIRKTAIFAPIASALFNIYKARSLASQGDPEWSKENLAAYEQKELAVMTATLTGIFLGNKILSGIGWLGKLATLFNPKIGSLINGLTSTAKTALAAFLALPEGAKFISNWLAGELFYNGERIPGGQTWEGIIGGLAQKGLDTAADVAKGLTGDEQGGKPVDGQVDVDQGQQSAEPALTRGVIGKEKQWMDPNAPTYARGLRRNPVTGQLEVDL